jgi:hypothetical protein
MSKVYQKLKTWQCAINAEFIVHEAVIGEMKWD